MARLFCPTRRPPTGRLVVLDDGSRSGEVIRIRQWPFIIGRSEGDLVLPHDQQISSRHAELSIRELDGQHECLLRDLGSTNGTFVRATRIALRPKQVFMLGASLFDGRNFDHDTQAVPSRAGATLAQADFMENIGGLDGWVPLLEDMGPVLRQITDTDDGVVLPLQSSDSEPEQGLVIGSDPDVCDLVVDDDFVDARHARIYRDGETGWRIDDLNSTNGVWFKIDRVKVTGGAEFQCGEQRFRLEMLQGLGTDRHSTDPCQAAE
jgi:pSer/pThr/pTyr-binding forkhead associated (FHA) protein